MTYIPNPGEKPAINHLDGNKQNNNVENLEWTTASDNTRHAYKIGLMKGIKGINAKPVVQLKGGETICAYGAILEASIATGTNKANISSCCQGRRKTAGGYVWHYA